MRHAKHLFLSIILAVILIPAIAFAQIPRLINYQGLVLNSNGTPVANGNHSFDFRIYNALNDGTSYWSETGVSIETTDGLFTRELGAITPFSPNLFVGKDSSLYLEVTVDGQFQTPRTRLISVPFAETAGNLNGQSPYTGGTGFRTFPFGSRFSTYGDDGLEQIRLWGEINGELLLFDGTPQNKLTAVLTSGGTTGGKLSLGSDSGVATILLDGGASGDNAVQLPSGSISATENLNEPGVANDLDTVFFTNLVTLNVDYNIASVTVTIPAAGYVELTAGCYVNTFHVAGTNTNIFVGISKTQNIDYFIPGCVVIGVPASRPTGTDQFPAYSTRLYSELAGTHTYYLVAERSSGGTTNSNIANPSIVAKYYPTAYGSIATTSFDNDPVLPHLTDISPDGSRPFNNPFVRIQSLEQINARLKAELDASLNELKRIQKLYPAKMPETQKEITGQKQ